RASLSRECPAAPPVDRREPAGRGAVAGPRPGRGSGRDEVLDGRAHEVEEVVGVEALAGVGVDVAGVEGRLEPLDRPAAALDVRVVGREQADLRPGLGDDPADVLGRVGGEADLPAYVLAGAQRQGPQALLVAAEGVE